MLRCFTILLIVLALAGCNLLQSKVSTETLEAELIRWIAEQGMSASEARCPAGQKLIQGHVFECTVVVDEVEVPVVVEVNDPATGTVEWKPKYKTVTQEQLQRWLRTLPDLSGRELTIDCPGTVFVSVPNSTVECEFFDQATQKTFIGTLEFTDGEGGYSWQIDPKVGDSPEPTADQPTADQPT
ncbi:MAG: DUF4333 domain-containing protein [Enhygromyxa sp.]